MKEETVKWKRHYGVWKGTCNKKPVAVIKNYNNGDYRLIMSRGKAVDIRLSCLFGLDMVKLLTEFYYELNKGDMNE